jgi:adenylyl-sulfate kinase
MTDNIFPEDIDGGGIRGQGGGVFWMTGLSGSGKSTLAKYIADILGRNRYYVYVLDGDNVRDGLCEDLGFSPKDRKENIRRVSYVARMMADAGLIVITAFISPYREDRAEAKRIIGDTFIEAHVSTSLGVCEGRDPKGLYVKARSGEIPSFTGISAPYEQPKNPDMMLPAGVMSIRECSILAIQFMRARWMI